MAVRNNGGCSKIVISFLGGSIILIGWAEFIFKPIRHYAEATNLTIGEAFGDLLKIQPSVYDWPFAGYVFLITSTIILYFSFVLIMRPVRAALEFIEGSEAPISILESKIELFMQDADMRVCETRRRQILHSNSEKVNAYHYSQSSTHGVLKKDLLRIESRIAGNLITDNLLKREFGKTLDTIELFNRELPTNLIATYLPDIAVLFLHRQFKLFKNSLITRECDGTDENEYSVQYPFYQLTVARYPVSMITLTLNFPVGSVYRKGTIKAFLIRNQAVREVAVAPLNDDPKRTKFQVEINKLKQQESLRIIWENIV